MTFSFLKSTRDMRLYDRIALQTNVKCVDSDELMLMTIMNIKKSSSVVMTRQ